MCCEAPLRLCVRSRSLECRNHAPRNAYSKLFCGNRLHLCARECLLVVIKPTWSKAGEAVTWKCFSLKAMTIV